MERSGSESNLFWVVGLILGIACGCAIYTAIVIETTLAALKNSNTMVVLIGANSFASDDPALERQLNQASNTLQIACEVSYCVVAVGIIISIGLAIRLLKK
jgi:hypothetical protein